MDDYYGPSRGPNYLRLAITVVVLLALAGGVYYWHLNSRPTLEKARSLGASGNMPAAVEMYAALADTHDLEAQKELGYILYHGDGVPADRERGLQYLRYVALGGDRPTQTFLGDLYYNELTEDDDVTMASIFLRLAADNGDAESAGRLARLYMRGRGMTRNRGDAAKYFEQAAKAGDVESSIMLGRMYLLGDGVEKNIDRAKAYLDKAADSEDPRLRFEIGEAYYDVGAPDLAIDHLLFASLRGVDDATYLLGRMYYYGEGVEQSYAAAADCLLPLAGKEGMDNVEVMVMLGRMYYYGHGVEQNYAAARTYLDLPAKRKHPMAMGIMGAMLVRGLGGDVDMALGLHYLRNALSENDTTAISAMGELHYYGKGVPFNRELALDYLSKAAAKGDEDARRVLNYYDGLLAQNAVREREAMDREIARRRHEMEMTLIQGRGDTSTVQREINRLELQKRQAELRARKADEERLREFEESLRRREAQAARGPAAPAGR